MENIHNKVNFGKLIYHFKRSTKDIHFNDFIDTETFFDEIKFKRIRLEDIEKNKMEFKSKLSSGRVGGNKSDKQLSKIKIYYEILQIANTGYWILWLF